ncbi:MAG: N-acetylmuramoyl-L-alanine amidase [Cyanothece sp. SIO2G6]|nr:N-acetylmuramoyl-L-alanine amidase [Cyanothece sp. SIO2G6]
MNLKIWWSEQLRWSWFRQAKSFRWVGFAISMMVMVAIAFFPLKSHSMAPLQYKATIVSPLTEATLQDVLPKFTDKNTSVATGSTPVEEVAPADPSNYGYRYLTDIDGNPANNAMIVVLHETVGSANSAINTFQTPHTDENSQVSYHSLIRRNGNIVHIVHPQMRAFGAGNSVFDGPNGPETVRTHPVFPGSVNNFAYHTSLESPSDGRGNQRRHSGYTEAQYQSLAWLIAHLPVPDERITTHEAVDQSGSRMDPRSFDGRKFLRLLHGYNRPY